MKSRFLYIIPVAMIAAASCSTTPKLNPDNIDEVIAAMTLEEKARLVVGTGMAGFGDSTENQAVVGETRSIVPGAAGTTYPIPRLGIPAVVLADGPAGLRINPTREGDTATYYCTHFPIGTLLACTWDTTLVRSVGHAIGNEVLEYGADVLLAPALNIQRNPLCGRNFEYYSEDPVVSGMIASAYIKGVQENGVGTSIKHFAVNNQETNRTANDAQVSPRALREIYLKGFEIAIKDSKPMTVMSSYNYVNGTYTSESEELQTGILRDEWGYDGMVMTDWFGGKDAVAQMKAGNDMLQPGYAKQYEAIVAAVKDGSLDEKVLDRNVRRILEMIVQTPRFKGYKYSNKPDLKTHAEITRRSATEGMVLLKNDDATLPLNKDIRNVALYGCTSYDFIAGGTGSGNVNRAYTVSLTDGLKNAGYHIDDEVSNAYKAHIDKENKRIAEERGKDSMSAFMPVTLPQEMTFDKSEIARQAERDDLAVITVGRGSGEFRDRESSNFDLSPANLALIKDVCDAFHRRGKKAVVILNVGGAVETASWKNYPDAILCAWQGGQEGGNSVADILTGKSYPSGKLTMTFPIRYQDHASTRNFPVDLDANININPEFVKEKVDDRRLVDFTPYEEDIYVGYRYFDSFGVPVSFPFGYGLSYTTFEYANPAVKMLDGGKYEVAVDIRNTGRFPGKEIAQLYVAAPDPKGHNKPDKELKAFAKTRELKPGEMQRVTMTVNAADLASYDEASSSWVVDEGEYRFIIGASAADIKAELPARVAASTTKTGDRLRLKATDFKRLTR